MQPVRETKMLEGGGEEKKETFDGGMKKLYTIFKGSYE